jgi:opacity protein-like surface antigen
MKKLLFLASLLALCLPLAASAQEVAPKVEIFGGYSYLRADNIGGVNAHGFNTSLAGNITKHVGVDGEFSRFDTSTSIPTQVLGIRVPVNSSVLTYLFGPRIVLHRGKAEPFVHALFGGAHGHYKIPTAELTDNAFAFALGGGLDVKVNNNFAIRAAQVDYLGYKLDYLRAKLYRNNFRYSTGVVIRLGNR